MADPNAHIPIGTVDDLHTGGPRTVERDYDTLLIPSARIDRKGIAELRQILDDGEAQILACEAEAAEDEAEVRTEP